MKRIILCFLMLLATGGVLRAEDVGFEATVNSSQVSLDEVVQLTLTITGVNDNLDPVSLPVIDGFTAKYLGPSTSVSIVNGNYHSERSFIYNLFPNKTGHFQIPVLSATISGHTYSTKPIDLEVTESPSQPPAASQADGQNQTAASQSSLKDKILVTATVGRRDVYLNQRVPLTIRLLLNDVPIRDIQYPQFEKDGFTVDDFEKPLQSARIIDGVKYDMVEFKTHFYPNRPGDLSLGPVHIQGNVLYKTQQNSLSNQDDIFGAGIFNNFFDNYTTRPVTVSADALQVHVSPLPDDNRPADFSGAIGHDFDFQASVSPLKVKAGDPLTLKLEITGSGNFKSIKIPVFNADGFKTYEPSIKDKGDSKSSEEVIIPTSVTVKEVPAIHFSYFDTDAKDYKTITRGPFAIEVMAASPDQEFKAIGFTDISHGPALLPSHQFSLGKVFDKLNKGWLKLSRSVWFWVSLGFMVVAWISYFLWRWFQEKLLNDPAFARRLKAVREARQALLAAQGYIVTGNAKDFYALLSRVLRDYLANKWHQSPAALSVEEIIAHLKEIKMDEALIVRIKDLLEQSDLVCFAGAERSGVDMRSDLAQTKDLISHLEKQLK